MSSVKHTDVDVSAREERPGLCRRLFCKPGLPCCCTYLVCVPFILLVLLVVIFFSYSSTEANSPPALAVDVPTSKTPMTLTVESTMSEESSAEFVSQAEDGDSDLATSVKDWFGDLFGREPNSVSAEEADARRRLAAALATATISPPRRRLADKKVTTDITFDYDTDITDQELDDFLNSETNDDLLDDLGDVFRTVIEAAGINASVTVDGARLAGDVVLQCDIPGPFRGNAWCGGVVNRALKEEDVVKELQNILSGFDGCEFGTGSPFAFNGTDDKLIFRAKCALDQGPASFTCKLSELIKSQASTINGFLEEFGLSACAISLGDTKCAYYVEGKKKTCSKCAAASSDSDSRQVCEKQESE